MVLYEKIAQGKKQKTIYFRIWKRNSHEYYAGVRPSACEVQEQALTMTQPWQ